MAVIIDGQTASFNKAMAQSQGHLKSFTSGIQSVGAALGITFGAVAIFNGIKAAVGIMSEFEATMSEVKAITGATGKEFEALQNDALKLGAATKFTSQQVGQLQVAYGRLGFNTQEILDATAATLDLAAATGEDLAKSADVAGSTVRGFGLNAKETQRVVDVMAASFNKTALGLDNFTESMKYVAPIASAANVSVEETTALLGVLADAGIRGSSAGTALRKIFGDLSKDGRPFQERLAELSKKGITLSDSFDEVGRTAQTALLVLTKNKDKADELTTAFGNVTGEAAKMARVMQDNLAGDVTKLSSAWEGLILSLSKTDFLRDATQALTAFLSSLSGAPADAVSGLDLLAQGIRDGVSESNEGFQEIIDRIKDVRREAGKPIDTNIAQELAAKYKLTEDQANALYRTILEVNKSLSFQEQVIATFKQFQGYGDLNRAAELYKEGLYKLIVAEQIHKDQLTEVASLSAAAETANRPLIQASDELIKSYYERINIIGTYVKSFETGEGKIQAASAKTVINLKYYKDAVTSLNKSFEELALARDDDGNFTDKTMSRLRLLSAEIAGNEELIKRVERLKASFKDVSYNIKPPDLTPLNNIFDIATGKLKEFKNEFGTLTHTSTIMEEVTARVEASMKKLTTATANTATAVKQSIAIDMAPLVSTAIIGIADAIGQAVAGVGSFGDNIIKVVAGFARQLGEILIATATAIIVTRKLMITNPYAALAAGIVLVALSSAAGAAISKSHSSSFGGGGSSGGSTSSDVTRNTSAVSSSTASQDTKITGTIVVRGQDLWVALNNYEQGNNFLKANG